MNGRLRFVATALPLLLLVLLSGCTGQSVGDPDVVSPSAPDASARAEPGTGEAVMTEDPAADPVVRKQQLVKCLTQQGIEIKNKERPMREVMELDQETVNRVMPKCMAYVPGQMH